VIAVLAVHVGAKAMVVFGMGDSIIVASVVAGAIGLALGVINGFFIATLKLPTPIVTLGTLNVFRGFLLTFVGTQR
jgi:ribose/xylose/arabinose/galactoside ABC-type transport system permease subunit